VLTLIVLAALFVRQSATTTQQQSPPLSASLSFSIDFPKTLVPTMVTHVTFHVFSPSEEVKSVILKTDSSALIVQTTPSDIGSGSAVDLDATVQALDVQDGSYEARMWVHYSDTTGIHDSDPIKATFFIVPHARINQPKWSSDLFHPFGKGTIGKTDSTTLLFGITSQSQSVVYQGMTAKLIFNVSAPGLSAAPNTISLDSIGPQGVSKDYAVTVNSNNTPPGVYTLVVSLYSKDNQLIAQGTLELTVTA
jgi:hypothetical protein